jgi:PAS domain S-box-containing protein
VKHFKESESHYVREENVLFPYLEKHGVTQPPAIMWMEHDKIREIKKGLYRVVETCQDVPFKDFAKQLEESGLALAEMLNSHFHKENSILFPTALNVIPEGEWKDVRRQFDELGYCCFTPDTAVGKAVASEAAKPAATTEGAITFETGSLTPLEIEAIFNHLPVDITFVDKDDTVRYFSQAPDRIFPRTNAVIGRKVQQCHPQKSVHVVQQILDDFRSGKRSAAQFWINLKGKLILIRYFAVRSQKGGYLGCLEVSQDITDIKKIEGEKRLLDG